MRPPSIGTASSTRTGTTGWPVVIDSITCAGSTTGARACKWAVPVFRAPVRSVLAARRTPVIRRPTPQPRRMDGPGHTSGRGADLSRVARADRLRYGAYGLLAVA